MESAVKENLPNHTRLVLCSILVGLQDSTETATAELKCWILEYGLCRNHFEKVLRSIDLSWHVFQCSETFNFCSPYCGIWVLSVVSRLGHLRLSQVNYFLLPGNNNFMRYFDCGQVTHLLYGFWNVSVSMCVLVSLAVFPPILDSFGRSATVVYKMGHFVI